MRWYRINQDQSEFFPELDIRLWGEFHQGCELRVCKFRAASSRARLPHLESACLQKEARQSQTKTKAGSGESTGDLERAQERKQRERQRETRGIKPWCQVLWSVQFCEQFRILPNSEWHCFLFVKHMVLQYVTLMVHLLGLKGWRMS